MTNVFDPRIHGCEAGKCVEAAQGRCRCKLLQPWDDRYILTGDSDTTDEDAEAICGKGGVEVVRCRRCEVIQGRQTDRFIWRRPECPRDAVQIQHRMVL